MDRRAWLLTVGLVFALILAVAGYIAVTRVNEPTSTGVISTPPSNEDAQSSTGESGDDASSTADAEMADSPDDPVPMPVVEELFAQLDEAGFKPAAEGTYTVQFDDSLQKVRIAGVFGDGTHKTFIFVLSGEEWELKE